MNGKEEGDYDVSLVYLGDYYPSIPWNTILELGEMEGCVGWMGLCRMMWIMGWRGRVIDGRKRKKNRF